MSILVTIYNNQVKSLVELFQITSSLASSLIYLILLFILFVVVEPEKIKPIAYILAAFILGSACTLMIYNFSVFAFRAGSVGHHVEYNLWNTERAGLLIGVSLFSFESISSIINGTQ